MITLRNRDDIVSLLGDRRALHSWSPVELQLDFLSDDIVQSKMEAQINAWKSECGCSLGAMTLWGGIALLIAWSIYAGFPIPGGLLAKLAGTMVWLLAFAVAGKLAGIAIARRKMRNRLRQLLIQKY